MDVLRNFNLNVAIGLVFPEVIIYLLMNGDYWKSKSNDII